METETQQSEPQTFSPNSPARIAPNSTAVPRTVVEERGVGESRLVRAGEVQDGPRVFTRVSQHRVCVAHLVGATS